MALFCVKASSQYLSQGLAIVPTYPVSISFWFYTPGAEQAAVCMRSTALAGKFIQVEPWNDNIIYASVSDGGSVFSATSPYTPNVWNHALAVYSHATLRRIYVNGIAGTDDTNNVTPNYSFSHATYIGRGENAAHMYEGRLAEVALWNAALEPFEARRLARGYSPLFIRPELTVSYTSLAQNWRDSRLYTPWTNVAGATLAPHPDAPRIIYPSWGKRLLFAAPMTAKPWYYRAQM